MATKKVSKKKVTKKATKKVAHGHYVDAVTGRKVSAAYAKSNPGTTVFERTKKKK